MNYRIVALAALAIVAACSRASVLPQSSQASVHALAGAEVPLGRKIDHIVFIVQENRTPDNLFQGLRGADIATSGKNSQGQTVKLHSVPLTMRYDLSHRHTGFLAEFDDGKMDGWSLEPSSHGCHRLQKSICAYGFVPASENAPYLTMARRYVFGDRMFQTNQGPSYPAHQYVISGDAEALPASPFEVAENPGAQRGYHGGGGGCDAPSQQRVALIGPHGFERMHVFPCFDRPVLSDLLDARGLTWRYYQDGSGAGLWRAFDSIQHVRYGPDYANVITTPDQIFSDVAQGHLANFVWLTPTGKNSDHSGSGFGNGPAWVAAVVNAIGKSRYWDSTAIVVTWDDWGGWFDHVRPPVRNSYELGFRVPLIVISPYAKSGYVSHVQYEFGSVLKFAEETFSLGSLGTTDAIANDLRDCFDFRQAPRKFRKIPAPPYQPDNSLTPGPPPDDDF